ncbi:hypothetical protein [Mycobacterium leprae]|uniref:hypothetical protein n=1 Tax=Mycobacterium leprae TaxID=1769 RepID=UPI00030A3992|nr:hypothetical protein [Mycobacterium leprae]
MTARQPTLPKNATRAGCSLDRADYAYEAILDLAFVVGPVEPGVGGLMITTLRLEGAGKQHHATRPQGLVSGIATRLRFMWSLRVLHTLAMIDLAITALYRSMESMLLPKYFTDPTSAATAKVGIV